MRVSVIITTYDQPVQLEKVLWGYASQRASNFELIVADDGSAPATTDVIDRVSQLTGLNLLHVWHEHRGFRKTEILNRAILAASTDYLIFSDGDCIPRDDFVATHTRLAERGYFLSGGYLKLSREVSERIGVADVRTGNATNSAWLRERGWDPGKRAFRLVRARSIASFLDFVTPTRRTWNGHNSSAWKDAILSTNGFDIDMGYGGLDRALGERLMNAGIRGRQVRHRAPCLHLHHERPYADAFRWKRNHDIRHRIRRNRETRARQGIAELPIDESLLIRRPGQLLEPVPAQRAAL